MIHATDVAADMIVESMVHANRVERFHLSYVAMTIKETTIKSQISSAAVMTTDHTHRTKTENMTLNLILDDAATTMQTGHKTKPIRIAK